MPKLPSSAMAHIVEADPRGRVEGLLVRPVRREAPVRVQAWDLDAAVDHGKRGKREVTLLQAEHLPAIAALLGREVAFETMRRNVLVRGVNLMALVGRRFRVGDVVLEGTEPCHPCSRMEEALGTGGYHAMTGHGGLCARVVRRGVLRVGDEVALAPGVPEDT